jgi:hypothetical protein
VASSVGSARENARPLSRLNREASPSMARSVGRTFVTSVSSSTVTRTRLSAAGAVTNTSDTAGSANRSESNP